MDDETLTKWVCRRLARIPTWWFDGAAPADQLQIMYGSLEASPDQGIGVRVYGTDDPRFDPAERRVQLRIRGGRQKREGADEIAAIAKAVLHGIVREDGISEILRISMSPLGADENERQERTENYLIILDNQEAHS